jgi:glycosyltransferase involved in cell wall biosynthesis
VRILHIADRLTERGGAYTHLLGVLDALGGAHEATLAVGVDEGTARAHARVVVLPGLEARTAIEVDLAGLQAAVRPDVVHVHNVMNPVVLEWAAAGGPALLTVQDHRFFCPTRGKWKTNGAACRETMTAEACAGCFDDAGYFRGILDLTRRRLAAAARLPLVVLSRYMRDELVQAGVAPAHLSVIPPFVHGLDASARPSGPPCVLFVGRLGEPKGVTEAVRAWRRAAVGLPLVIAGGGPLRERLAEPGVEVLGFVPHARLAPLYARARALLLPSRWQEPFGIVGLEALHFGVPVAAWESGGVAEWHPGAGLLVPWGDEDALADALRRAVRQRAVPAAGFGRDEAMARLVALYADVARRPSGAGRPAS